MKTTLFLTWASINNIANETDYDDGFKFGNPEQNIQFHKEIIDLVSKHDDLNKNQNQNQTQTQNQNKNQLHQKLNKLSNHKKQ